MQTGLARLFSSSKALTGIVLSIAVVALAIAKVVDGPLAVETLKWLALAYMGSTAVEDGAKALATRPVKPAPSAVATINTSTPPPPSDVALPPEWSGR